MAVPAPALVPSLVADDEAPAAPEASVGVYVHVPFCAHVCPYCDFNTYSGLEGLIPRYVEAVAREMERAAREIAGRRVATIFFGGGTPSLLSPTQVERI